MVASPKIHGSTRNLLMSRRWWCLRLAIGGGLIVASLITTSKEGMWLFAAGILVVLATLMIGALRSAQRRTAKASATSDDQQPMP